MALIPSSKIHKVRGITVEEKELIKNYMQGAIYTWIKRDRETPFAVRDLVGGINNDWTGTPLIALYKKHRTAGKDSSAAIAGAGVDLGWIVKEVLASDKRAFKVKKRGLVSSYSWISGVA